MGKWGSEADERYRLFLKEWSVSEPVISRKGSITVKSLCVAWLEEVGEIFKNKKNKAGYNAYRMVIRILSKTYGHTNANDFKARSLKVLRKELINSGDYSRQYINKLMGYTKSIFYWGAENELVSAETAASLRLVKALKFGETTAYESPDPITVPDETVNKTLPYLTPTIRDMVRIQSLTGARPSEICIMRMCDVSINDNVAVYWPSVHKNTWRGKNVLSCCLPMRMILFYGVRYRETLRITSLLWRNAERERREAMSKKCRSKITPSQIARQST
jgi:integrase